MSRVTLGRYIREARESAGLSQSELAEAIGTSQGQISRIESGAGMPSAIALARLGPITVDGGRELLRLVRACAAG